MRQFPGEFAPFPRPGFGRQAVGLAARAGRGAAKGRRTSPGVESFNQTRAPPAVPVLAVFEGV